MIKKVFKSKKGLGMLDISIYLVLGVLVVYLITFVFCFSEHLTIQKYLDSTAESTLDAVSQNREINSAMVNHFTDEVKPAKFIFYDANSKFHFDFYKYDFAGNSINTTHYTSEQIQHSAVKLKKGDLVRVEITYGFLDGEDTPLTRLSKIMSGSYGGTTYKASLIGYAEGGVD